MLSKHGCMILNLSSDFKIICFTDNSFVCATRGQGRPLWSTRQFFSHSFRDFRSFFYFVCFLDKFIALLLLQVLVHFRCISADSFDLNSDETDLLSVPKT